MPRNMSFALTIEPFVSRTKTVTRRNGWQFLKPGDVVMGCKKCMGLRRGEKVERLGLIRVVLVDREPLIAMHQYGQEECAREGFPDMTPTEFIEMYCRHNGRGPLQFVTRIRFEYV